MDYKEIIEAMRSTDVKVVFCRSLDAADAIETLLAERDAAVEDLRPIADCASCKWYFGDSSGEVCDGCDYPGEGSNWEWRGPQKGDGYGD